MACVWLYGGYFRDTNRLTIKNKRNVQVDARPDLRPSLSHSAQILHLKNKVLPPSKNYRYLTMKINRKIQVAL